MIAEPVENLIGTKEEFAESTKKLDKKWNLAGNFCQNPNDRSLGA